MKILGYLLRISIFFQMSQLSGQDLQPLYDAAALPGKPFFLTSGAKGQVILWQDNIGEESRRYALGGLKITAISPHPQGQGFAAAGEAGDIFLRTYEGKDPGKTWKADEGFIRGLTFNPSGDRLFSLGDTGNLAGWSYPTGEKLFTWKAPSGGIRCYSWSLDRQSLFLGSEKGAVIQFDPQTLKVLKTWQAHSGSIQGLKTIPGRPGALISSGADGHLIIWNIHTSQAIQKTTWNQDFVQSLAISENGSLMACGFQSGALELRDPQTLGLLWKTQDHLAPITQVLFLRSQRNLVTVSLDQTIKLWNTENGQKWGSLGRTFNQATPDTMFEEAAIPAVLNRISLPDGRQAIIRSWRPMIFLKDHQIQGTPGPEALALAWDPQNKNIVFSTSGGFLGLLQYPHFTLVWKKKISEKNLTALAVNPGAREIWAGTEDGTLFILDSNTGEERYKQRSHTDQIRQIAFRPNQSEAGTCGDDGLILRWDTKKRQVVTTYTGHSDYVRTLAYSPDGGSLASGGDDLLINLWDLKTGRQTTWTNQNSYVFRLAFSPDGKKIAKTDGDSLIIFDKNQGQTVETIPWPGEKIVFLDWDPDDTLSLGTESGKFRTSTSKNPRTFQEYNGQ